MGAPFGMGVVRLSDLPAESSRQHLMLGFNNIISHSFEPRLRLRTVSVAGQPDFKAKQFNRKWLPPSEIGLCKEDLCTDRTAPLVRGLFGAKRGNSQVGVSAWWWTQFASNRSQHPNCLITGKIQGISQKLG